MTSPGIGFLFKERQFFYQNKTIACVTLGQKKHRPLSITSASTHLVSDYMLIVFFVSKSVASLNNDKMHITEAIQSIKSYLKKEQRVSLNSPATNKKIKINDN